MADWVFFFLDKNFVSVKKEVNIVYADLEKFPTCSDVIRYILIYA